MRFRKLAFAIGILVLVAAPVRADRYVYEPISDLDDGEWIDAQSFDAKLQHLQESDLYLTLGSFSTGEVLENTMAFRLPDLAEGQAVSDARLRLNQQGGVIETSLTIRISGALDLDPLATPTALRSSLPRTTTSVDWHISAEWDSSGQRIAKYADSPDLHALIEELLAQPGWDGASKDVVLFLEVPSPSGNNYVRFDDIHPKWTISGNGGIDPARLILSETYHDAFWGKELLCRPTPTSMGLNVIPHRPTQFYAEFGPDSLTLNRLTSFVTVDTGQDALLTLTDLAPGTRYWYRLRYRAVGETGFETGPMHSFVTMPVGGELRLAVTTDIHVTNMEALGLDSTMSLLEETLSQIRTHHEDGCHAWIDLGDLVVIRAQRIVFDLEETEQRYRAARERVEKLACCVPLIAVRGNHEEVNGWDDNGTAENSAVWSGNTLKKYLVPPLPGGFYSGNTTAHSEIGLPGNYFAFQAGGLRIRCLDPYLFSMTRPHNGHGETGGSEDPWDWTLGLQQYQWLRDDLAAHPSPYGLVLVHHLVSSYDEPWSYYGRGGVEVVDWNVDGRPSFEWGGQDANGQDVLAQKRPAFTDGSIHDMLHAQGNQVVMKGHDHFYGRQELDGMVYLTMAKPDDDGTHTGDLWGWAASTHYPGDITTFYENSGFLAVTADPTAATFEYVKTFPVAARGTVADSFTILPTASTSVPGEAPRVRRTWIHTVYPNPARVAPRIDFELGRDTAEATLSIHDVNGRLVSEVFRGALLEGRHTLLWDATDRSGRRAAAGIYFAKLSTGRRTDSVKLILLR